MACKKLYLEKEQSPSIERRFITLLDSDRDQLPHRLRQMLALLKEYPIDFQTLLRDLGNWNSNLKKIQYKWAQDFYRDAQDDAETELTPQEDQAV